MPTIATWLSDAIDDALAAGTDASTSGGIAIVAAPPSAPLPPAEPTGDELDDMVGALQVLASFVTLPDPLPEPGAGWRAHTQFLRIADGDAAAVVEQLLDAVPGAEKQGHAAEIIEALGSIASDAAAQIRQGIETLSGEAVLRAPREALARMIVLTWVTAEQGMPIYRAEEADARKLLERVPADERAKDYTQRLAIFQGIKRLGDAGIVDLLRTPVAKTSGRAIGGWPALIIAAAAVVVLLAAVVMIWSELERRQRDWEKLCLDEKGQVRADMRSICAGLLAKPLVEVKGGWGIAAAIAAAAAALLLLSRRAS